jgi:hypothetical protein
MRKNKDIVKDALLTAKELEQAAKRNAQDVIIEAFTPRLIDVIRQTLSEEGPGPQLADPVTKLAKGEEEETESDEVQNKAEVSDGHPEKIKPGMDDREIGKKGKKHDLDRAAPAPGQMTEEEELDDEEDVEDVEEGEDHDIGKLYFDDRDEGDSDFLHELDLDDEDDEMQFEDDDMDADDEELVNQDPIDAVDDVFEQDEDEDEELELPDELFNDENDQDMDDVPSDEPVDAEASAEEAPMEDEEDDELDEEDEELDIDIEDDEADMEENDMDAEEYDDGLYVRREGQFMKVNPSEALEDKMNDLEEEKTKLANAVATLKGQLGEVNLFNAKMAHLVKLYESGLFSRSEKRRIAERLDSCKSTKQVQVVYKNIVKEADSRTVLDDIHDVITESRVRRSSKPSGESVYESDEVRRMRKLAGLDN